MLNTVMKGMNKFRKKRSLVNRDLAVGAVVGGLAASAAMLLKDEVVSKARSGQKQVANESNPTSSDKASEGMGVRDGGNADAETMERD